MQCTGRHTATASWQFCSRSARHLAQPAAVRGASCTTLHHPTAPRMPEAALTAQTTGITQPQPPPPPQSRTVHRGILTLSDAPAQAPWYRSQYVPQTGRPCWRTCSMVRAVGLHVWRPPAVSASKCTQPVCTCRSARHVDRWAFQVMGHDATVCTKPEMHTPSVQRRRVAQDGTSD
jgi:hypothetical protein